MFKRAGWCVAVVALALMGSFIHAAGRADQQQDGYAITISPKVIVLDAQSECVTVHSNIPYGLVDPSSLALEGVAPYLVKKDNMGYMVAKFDFDAIAELVQPPSATLTLTGELEDGTPLCLSDTVSVK